MCTLIVHVKYFKPVSSEDDMSMQTSITERVVMRMSSVFRLLFISFFLAAVYSMRYWGKRPAVYARNINVVRRWDVVRKLNGKYKCNPDFAVTLDDATKGQQSSKGTPTSQTIL